MKTIINFDVGVVGLMCQYSDICGISKLSFMSSDIILGGVYVPSKTITINNIKPIVNLLNELHKIDFTILDTIFPFGVGITGIFCQYFFDDDGERVGLIIAEGCAYKNTTITINGVANIKRLITKLENIVEGFDIDED